jgi:putative membrane protein
MKVLVSIIFNIVVLFILAFLLWESADGVIEAWIVVEGWWKTYVIWWIVLWLINIIIRPILKILSLPLFFVFLGLISFIINGVILWLFNNIFKNVLMIDWVSYEIHWSVNFIIAVAIFTILNTLYSLLFSKKK